MIRIGLPKGGIKSKSLDLIKRVTGTELEDKRLNYIDDEFEIYLLKHRDIPKMLHEGLLDIGITSYEWVAENGFNLEVIRELDWCDTFIALIGKEMKNGRTNCSTEFYNIVKRYVEEKNLDMDIYRLSGSGEAGIPTLFDYCVDCVESGETLKKNNLVVLDKILESKVVVVCKDKSVIQMEECKKLLDAI